MMKRVESAMPRYVQSPNLPETAVCHALIAESACALLQDSLAAQGVRAVAAPKTLSLPYRVNDHADMNCRHLGGKELLVFQDAVFSPRLNEAGLHPVSAASKGGDRYPRDAALNALLISGFAFHKTDITDQRLRQALEERNYAWVHVNQGYTACSAAIVDAYSLITADEGIAAAAEQIGFDVLKITSGFVDLPGYDYGFLGGACGKLGPDRLAFTGRIDRHPDCARILDFLAGHGVAPVYLTERPCFDCGGIIPVTQL